MNDHFVFPIQDEFCANFDFHVSPEAICAVELLAKPNPTGVQ
jgi:hypothetical protein